MTLLSFLLFLHTIGGMRRDADVSATLTVREQEWVAERQVGRVELGDAKEWATTVLQNNVSHPTSLLASSWEDDGDLSWTLSRGMRDDHVHGQVVTPVVHLRVVPEAKLHVLASLGCLLSQSLERMLVELNVGIETIQAVLNCLKDGAVKQLRPIDTRVVCDTQLHCQSRVVDVQLHIPDLTIGIGQKGPVPVRQMTQHLEHIWPSSTGSKGRAQIRTQRDKCKGTVVLSYMLEEPL